MTKKISIAISGIGNRAMPKDKNKAFWSGWVDQIKKSSKYNPEKRRHDGEITAKYC